ncbi:MAG: 4Fe-4S dicluster domain-containing protein [Spirochaetaceae bacterium]|jgi:electron transport complex protein RnfC|nr:4Fe-4S dicluster domain-containing protein [Spirochaetaceae bacterium]
MKVYSFLRGGIDLSDNSAPLPEKSSLSFLPPIAVLPMIQHNGVHSYPVVSVGDHVEEGGLIARSQGAGSANIHAPIPGKVVQLVNWKLPEKMTNDAVVIKLEGRFSLLGKEARGHEWKDLSPFEIQALMAEYGVVEMEGRGAPLTEIFSEFTGVNGVATLVVRCVFDDPWLAADYCLCREKTEAVAEGALIAAKAACADQICISVSSNEKNIAFDLLDVLKKSGETEAFVIQVSNLYPQHGKMELSFALRQAEKKENRRLGSLLFLGPASLEAVYTAVKYRRPVLSRYVAIGGSAIKEPRVVNVRLGTRIADVFKECGGCASPKRVAYGSPMMGRAVFSLDEPIIKTTYAVFAAANETFSAGNMLWNSRRVLDLRSEERTPGKIRKKNKLSRRYLSANHCINCGECREVCPVGLDPEDIYKNINGKKHGLSVSSLVMQCHGCGCCEAVCPSNLPLCTTIINPAFKGD